MKAVRRVILNKSKKRYFDVRDTDNKQSKADSISRGYATVKRIIVIKRRLDISDG